MRRMFRLAMTVLIFLIVGCTAPRVALKPIGQYKFHQEQEGLKIAVDPFFERERLKKFFGTNLLSHGILPILIVVENNNANAGFLLERKSFSIVMKDEQKANPREGENVWVPYPKALEATKTPGGIILGGAAIVAPGVILASLPLIFYAAKVEGDVDKINLNLSEKAFADRTIFPGELHSGFFYFTIGDQKDVSRISTLLIKAKHIQSEEEIGFVFEMIK